MAHLENPFVHPKLRHYVDILVTVPTYHVVPLNHVDSAQSIFDVAEFKDPVTGIAYPLESLVIHTPTSSIHVAPEEADLYRDMAMLRMRGPIFMHGILKRGLRHPGPPARELHNPRPFQFYDAKGRDIHVLILPDGEVKPFQTKTQLYELASDYGLSGLAFHSPVGTKVVDVRDAAEVIHQISAAIGPLVIHGLNDTDMLEARFRKLRIATRRP